MDAPLCPRCGHYIPNDENPGAYSGAISRVDNRTQVCSPCGTREALFQFFEGHLPDLEVDLSQSFHMEPIVKAAHGG